MFNKYSKRNVAVVSTLVVAIVIGLLATIGQSPLAAANGAPDFPERGEGVGHGDYCVVAERGVYFLGRDLGDQVNGWIGFARWCEQRDGRLAWSE